MAKASYLPEALHRRGELEDTYERLLTELSWLLDPLEHNPWPHHATISGASLGITRAAYCRVGRLASRPAGRGQSADRLAFAPGCENSLLSDCPRDHVGSNEWARAGRRRGHPCRSEAGSRRHSVTRPWSHFARRSRAPHGEGVCDDCMARDALLSIETGRRSSRSRPARGQ